MSKIKFHIIIPARYASTRFPGKPLVDIAGKPMIVHVCEKARLVRGIESISVATDDDRIASVLHDYGANVIMTSSDHVSGTDRLAEALKIIGIPESDQEVIVNLQGDEPFIKPYQIESLCKAFSDKSTDIVSLCKEITDHDDLANPNLVKVVRRLDGHALYFSRSVIPFKRNSGAGAKYFKHIGIYAYRSNILSQISKLNPSDLEITEQLEQLRWLDHGYAIRMIETDYQSPAVDSPEDLKKILEQFGKLEN
ncbi:MAG: 3-deoxy-manno-octulosonate cytidylyltransferase [Flavobacteriales bacterium]